MSHIHIPDGVIAPIWLLLGFILTGLGVAFSLYRLRHRDLKELVPKLGVVCALVLLAMSVPLGPIPAHLNLTVFMGIVLGPWLGFIAAFIINLLLGFVGHGGLTVVGINTLLIGLEAMFGYGIFTVLSKQMTVVRAAALTVILTLVLSNALMLEVVVFSGVDPGHVLAHDEHDEHDGAKGPKDTDKGHQDVEKGLKEQSLPAFSGKLQLNSWPTLAKAILPIAGTGILLETVAISVLVNFILRVRPDILGRDGGQENPEQI